MTTEKLRQNTPKVRLVTVDAEQAGQRIDNFLLAQLRGVPRTLIYRILRKGEVRVNGGRVKPVYRITTGDQVRIPPVHVDSAKTVPKPRESQLTLLQANILFEDADLIALNKPSGMAVHGGSGVQLGVIENLRALYPQAKRMELVHRLDRETSGVLLIAKKTSVLRNLHEQIRSSQMHKTYVCLVNGEVELKKQVIDVPLRKNQLSSGERIVKVSEDGKPSESIFLRQQVFANFASLLEVQLITGRTHQIRVHGQYIGHPIAGDDKYGDKSFNKTMQAYGLKRLFLHAKSLRFKHPKDQEWMTINAPLPDDLQICLKSLKGENE
ncbi:MAG: 23S rRNA pseudouridine(955/2504/2580) synthase RluC [Gammaproteobacteria bacterium]|nr:23S rRNA pseudouridine(955/2504/2580) synthase RluC [Gammaproteobacteria bacterium]MDH5728380.1 23S rRNA pseudouridine(955/2504/2580) synthase RluC [Gammaproteobacteria bacterium]